MVHGYMGAWRLPTLVGALAAGTYRPDSLIATVIMCGCYLPTHEAQHGNIGRPNTSLRWLNELVGHVSVFPIVFPYRLHRAIHLKHHAHSNDPVRDPDMYIKADTIWGAAKNAWLSKQPGHTGALSDNVLMDNPNKDRLIMEAILVTRLAWLLAAVLAWSGSLSKF
jgi:beta-carotene hydroxylase